ncbi:DUF2169 domain-containing protein [Sorangium sp. So ce1036]|uniref:DUF2169 family type VI secretion system accessory protein n=1 Tax=Sorangium sp. So ce1036 TaxID=3133328 RepID=UPI003F01DAFD
MDVVSACPLRVASCFWQPQPGAWALTIVCKATYTLTPGESPLAQEQDEPTTTDVYWEDDRRCSLYLASDLAPFKRRADVLVVGHAHAPGRQPVTSLIARLAVGAIDKSIAVLGDCALTADRTPTEPAPFAKMPLRWERAAGGSGTANPVGISPGAAPDGRGAAPAPNLQPAGPHVTGRLDVLEPAGLGPIAPDWPSRAHWLGWHAATWDHERWHEQPMPHDIDASYFNAAPPDQQLDEICPDERIVLENLHPIHPRLVTQLRAAVPRALVQLGGATAQERRLRCDTLCIDTDRGTCTLTWRANVLLDHPQQAGQVVITLAEADRAPASAAPASERAVTDTLPTGLTAPPQGVLPFGGTAASAPPAPPSAPPPHGVLPFSTTMDVAAFAPQAASPHGVLPFSTTMDVAAFASQAAAPHDVLPFSSTVTGRTTAPPSAPELAPPHAPPSSPSLETAPHEPVSAPEAAGPSPPPLAAPVEPPMLGPLARLEALARPEAPAEGDRAPAMLPAPPATAELLTAEEQPEASAEELSVEACAALDASLSLRPRDSERILRETRLTEPAWARLRARWAAEIKRELGRGRSGLLRAYDAAYVAQLERERGPISPDELARITVAMERGDLAEALRDMGLPGESAIRVQRTWIGRIARDAALGDAVRQAVARARAS